jgi:uncharacterized RDD family membrane protein YckC
MDRNIDVRTPESIAFRYELAGLGSRFLAVAVDLAIQIAIVLLLVWGVTALAAYAPPQKAPINDNFAVSLGIGILIALLFLIFYGYFIIFEAFWNGQTPGKKALGIRVVRDGGYPIDFGSSLVRNIIRIGEQALGFYAFAALSALISPENKRIGDYAAGTIVVRDARVATPETLRHALANGTQARSSAYLTDAERVMISQYLGRRNALDAPRRRELAAQLAARLRDRAPADLRNLPDEELLERI